MQPIAVHIYTNPDLKDAWKAGQIPMLYCFVLPCAHTAHNYAHGMLSEGTDL